MHSIIIYGDYRRHIFNSNTAEPLRRRGGRINGWIQGGVFLMRQAIEGFLDGLPFDGTHPPPKVFSFAPYEIDEDATGFEQIAWTLRTTTLDDPLLFQEAIPKDAAALRLLSVPPPSLKEIVLPRVSPELVLALGPYTKGARARKSLPSGYFDPPGKGLDYCPDIVVFDDLGGSQSNSLRHLDLVPYGLWDDVPNNPRLRPAIAHWNVTTNFDEDRSHAFAEGAALLLARLRHAVASPIASGASQSVPRPLEPIIICSVRGSPPRLDRALSASGRNYWDVLLADSKLRQRTVVLLDAADLRGDNRDEHGSDEPELAISSGLSWETTAQDTIAELYRSKSLRRVLEFSQVIVRFGYCGALHISRRGDRDWDYQLYYDPQRDDGAWTDQEKKGTVLGESALFVGAFVQHLTRVCLENEERPVLQDLSRTIGEALPDAIRATQRLMNFAYGNLTESHLTERYTSDPDAPSPNFRDDVYFGPPDRSTQPIASATVPPLRNRVWSLLSAATQGRSGRVARQIVKYGPSAALLQQVPTLGEFAESLAGEFAVQHFSTDAGPWLQPVVGQPPIPELLQHLNQLVTATAAEVIGPLTRLTGDRKGVFTEEVLRAVGALDLDVPDVRALLTNNWNTRNRPIAQLFDVTEDWERISLALSQAVGRELRQQIELPSGADPRFDAVIAPVYQVSGFSVVDRREIEGIREIRKLIKLHLDEISTKEKEAKRRPDVNTPLSLAVFGPPGAGKSAAVRAIIKTLEEHDTRPEALGPYNLAEFSSVEDLHGAFKKVIDVRARSRVPIVFFDEFDSRFHGEEWGWLKFFLAPMEDGLYRDQPVHTAVFVFAGGTSATYADFSLRNRPSTDPQMQAFVRAKGPDFVSRLKGHLDVVGVNPADSDDDLYLIRRAVVVRNILAKIQALGDGEEARIDRNVLRAILFVPQYRNGARSIRKLIEMCPGSARRVTNGALPPINQLNMVTDGAAFLDLLSNVSAEEYESRS